jgi:hypothetical protein
MVVLLHGDVGGWDEVAIAVAAFAVLWLAIKLAGRKPASDEEGGDEDADADSTPEGSASGDATAAVDEPTNPTRRSSKLA